MAGPGTPGWAVPAGEDYLVREIAALKTAQREGMASIASSFGPVVAALQAQTAALAAQDVVIAAQVASIAALVGQQTTGDAGNAATPTYVSLGGSYGAYAVITFTVPAGYTQAAISANSAAAVGATQPVQILTNIGGASGPFMNIYPTSGFGNGASNFSRKFAVTPGGTFTVSTYALVSGESANALLTTAASVTYYR